MLNFKKTALALTTVLALNAPNAFAASHGAPVKIKNFALKTMALAGTGAFGYLGLQPVIARRRNKVRAEKNLG